MPLIVVIRGGGDLASGVALRLFRAGLRVLITELPQPLAVRRWVSFAEAIYQGQITIEGVTARKAQDLDQAVSIFNKGEIPVLNDPGAGVLQALALKNKAPRRVVLVDGRMKKIGLETEKPAADMVIGLGPGFIAGQNCDVVIETNRGHFLGRVIWHGAPEGDTGIPDRVAGRKEERVLRAPADGILETRSEIGDHLQKDQLVAEVSGMAVFAPFKGVLRGLLRSGVTVYKGLKIGDVDPRNDLRYCSLVSDKSLAMGGSVLEAILSQGDLRPYLWE